MAVAVCGAIEASPGYSAFVALLDRLFGRGVGDAFRAPFVLGDAKAMQLLADDAGLRDASVVERVGEVRFSSIADLVATERACVWTLGGLLDDEQFGRLKDAADRDLAPFLVDGGVAFAMPALILTAGPSLSRQQLLSVTVEAKAG
jgi:hypothetical protein